VAEAGTLRQRASSYRDTNALARYRLALDMDVARAHTEGTLTGTNYSVGATRDIYLDRGVSRKNAYARENYGGGQRIEDSATVTASQTWNKLTDTRQMASWRGDEAATSKTAGIGGSHWMFHESWQWSLDLSRTWSDRPKWEYLDIDTELVEPLTRVTSTGTSVSARHLMNPTTVMLYTLSYVVANDRPPSRSGAVLVKHYLPDHEAALHATLSRAINRGVITTATTYGQVDAWQVEVAALKSLNSGKTRGKASYRWYREDEETRAYGDLLTFGSDTFALNIAHDIARGEGGEAGVTLEAGATKYLANTGLSAAVWEGGVSAKF
jgi:hypothetical protein